jgi:hypothetical protein
VRASPIIRKAMAKRAVAIAALAIAGAQAGHLLAYQLRFGANAFQVQSSGVHAYFPALVKTSLGALALTVMGALLLVAASRVVARGVAPRRISGPTFISLLATLFTIQLAWFIAQEVTESLAAGARIDSASNLLLWGMVGQLPVAVVGAAALRWLWTRVEAAASELASVTRVSLPAPVPAPLALLLVRDSDHALLLAHASRSTLAKRGPPSSF